MKTNIISILALGLLSVAGAKAQNQNDPSYSPNNYKHPNKAEYMKQQADLKPIVYLEEVKEEAAQPEANSVASNGNYKGMHPEESKIKKFRATNAPSARPYHLSPAASGGNYKMQFPSRPRKKEAAVPVPETTVSPTVSN